MEVRLECMTSLLIVSGTEEVLRSYASIEIIILSTCYEIGHFLRRNMFDDDIEIGMILGNSFYNTSEFSLGSVDETFCDLCKIIFCDSCFWVEREDDIAFYHRFENSLGFWVFRINISA